MEFFDSGFGLFLLLLGQVLAVTGFVMISLLFLVYGDRKIWGAVQMRRGPNVVGPWGLFQTVADFVKYVGKEIIIPAGADKFVFLLAPLLSFVLALIAWAVVPFNEGWVEVSIGFIIIGIMISTGSLNLTAVVMAQDGDYGLLNWYWLPHLPMVVLFFVSALAETNRPPFDLPEAESELVAGYQVEYSSTPFLLPWLGGDRGILGEIRCTGLRPLVGWRLM